VNVNGAYDAMTDVIVAGTASGGDHLVYTTDLLGNPRIGSTEIDRGAYEYTPPPPPAGTVVVVH
jgi:hypothetical protein